MTELYLRSGRKLVILPAVRARRPAAGVFGVPGFLRGLGFREALLVSIEQAGFLSLFVWVRTARLGAITRLSVRWFRSHENPRFEGNPTIRHELCRAGNYSAMLAIST